MNKEDTHLNLSLVCEAMSRVEYWRDPPFVSRACAGSHVGLEWTDKFDYSRELQETVHL